jgi:hypothetical protein
VGKNKSIDRSPDSPPFGASCEEPPPPPLSHPFLPSVPCWAEADFTVRCPLGGRRVDACGRGEKGPVDGTCEGGVGRCRRGEKPPPTRFSNCACLIYLCLQSISFYWVVERFGGMRIRSSSSSMAET